MLVKLLAFEVAGVTYRPAHAQERADVLQTGELLDLEREPDNEFDKYAIKVFALDDDGVRRTHIGYIPKTLNVCVANLMDAGMSMHSRVVRVERKASLRVAVLTELGVDHA
jgi:hypothetical protein